MVLKSLISEPSEHVLDFIFGYFDDKFHIGSHLFLYFFLFFVYLPALCGYPMKIKETKLLKRRNEDRARAWSYVFA